MKTKFEYIYNEVIGALKDRLPKYLTYHDVNHTLYVLDRAIYIAQKEKISSKDLNLLKTAVLFHDIGFIHTHIEHEKRGCEIARTELLKYDFSKSDIDKICGMIIATKIPQRPNTLLEKIIADADLEYLSTKHFEAQGEKLFIELKHFNDTLTRKVWNTIQIDFLKAHQYHTNYCKRYKEFRKVNNLNKLIENNI